MQKFLETKKFFQKILENFQPPPRKTSAYTSIFNISFMNLIVADFSQKNDVYV